MAGPTRSRGELISSFAGSLFATMLGEVVMDAALQAHRDLARSRAICEVCGMRCGSVHVQAPPSNSTGHSMTAPGSPTDAGLMAAGISTPTAKDKNDGNIYFECTNCQKKIASNRYAPHLSSCLGIGTGSRRGAARNAAAKNKPSAEPDRAGSPFVSSDYGSPQEGVSGKGKGKAKNGKKINVVEPSMNGNNKRLMTPDASSKKAKKQKASIAGSEHPSTLASEETNMQKRHLPGSPRLPSKDGKKSASPYMPRSPSVTSASQYSGNESPSGSGSGSGSSLNIQSPRLSDTRKRPASIDQNSVNPKGHSLQPGSGKSQVAVPEAAAAKRKTEDKEDPDFIDVDGEDRDESSPEST